MHLSDKIAKVLIFTGLAVLVVIAILFSWREFANLTLSSPINDIKLGSLGSAMSGLVGTIWSLAGVILFYVALTEQRNDFKTNQEGLKNQIREYELHLKELEDTRNAYFEQSMTQNQQRFENTFFQLITLHNNIVAEFEVRDKKYSPNVVSKGRESFQAASDAIKTVYNKDKSAGNEQDPVSYYMVLFDNSQANLSHYFRNLYHIYKFIDKATIDNKRFYSGVIRAQLSAYELALLFYNCLSEHGMDKFKPYIERYAVFKNLDRSNIADYEGIFEKYSPQAYGHKNFNFLMGG